MHISLVNCTKLPDIEVLRVVRAINRQLTDDFEPHWHLSAELRLEGRTPLKDAKTERLKQNPPDLRGDAIVYLWDKTADVSDALGYHDANNRGVPYGFVFTDLAKRLGEHWSVTLSHEVLELVGDANANKLAAGPHPAHPDRLVFHWLEMCDAVQAEHYDIDGVAVSNFVLPLYFTPGEQLGARNDFLNQSRHGATLRSFGVNPGGYVGFFDPALEDHDTFTADDTASKRMRIKSGLGRARRSRRYRALTTQPGSSPRLAPELEPLPRVKIKQRRKVS